MAVVRDDEEERTARIDQLLEELRLNTEDLHELAKQAFDRAEKAIQDARQVRQTSQHLRERRRHQRHAHAK